MLIFFVVIINLRIVLTIRIGRVYEARLITSSDSIWLYEQINTNACIYTAMQLFNKNFLALNYFSSNQSCQIFNSSIDSPEIISNPNSTLILREKFVISCCSNVTWLLKRIDRASKSSAFNVTNPTFLSINPINNFLSVMSYHGLRTLFNRKNLSIIINTTSVGSNCAIASQYDNFYIASCDYPDLVQIYNETDGGLKLFYSLNITNNPRQTGFIFNNTWLLVSIQYVRRIDIYSVNLTTKTFQYNQSIVIPYDIVWTLTKHSDILIYICFWKTGTPVFTFSYKESSWILSNLTATKTSNTEIPTQVNIDSCGRLWITIYGFGIRIFDITGQHLLANWTTISTDVDTLLVLENYEIFLGDYDNNRIDYYATNLQCTLGIER